ncbi:RND transporter [Bacillus sp. AK031]
MKKKKTIRNKKQFRMINWIVFGVIVLIGSLLAFEALEELDRIANSPRGDEAQSRIDFRWDTGTSRLGMLLLFLTALLAIGWKRVFPFNVPLAIILFGFCYFLFFMVFTTGWVGLIGIIGLGAALAIAIIMIISYAIYLW